MREESSSILTDVILLHTIMAGYYAVHTRATTGISRIEVARSAVEPMLAPKAIDGTINVIAKEVKGTNLNINPSMEDNDNNGESKIPSQENTS